MIIQDNPNRSWNPPATSLWGMLRIIVTSYDTQTAQMINGLWGILWGLAFIVSTGHIFVFAPRVYGWMAFSPEWVWGIIWLAKGIWQIIAVLGHARSKDLLFDSFHSCRRTIARNNCLTAAWFSVLLAFVLAFGYVRVLGLFNPWAAYCLFWLALDAWCLRRLVHD